MSSRTKVFCFISQNPLNKLRYSLVFTKSRVFLWVANFWGLTVCFVRLPTLLQTFITRYMSLTKNIGFFHSRGYLSLLAIPNTRIFYFLFLLCDRETHFLRYPILPSPPSNTKHSVDLYHALTPMSCDVPYINEMQCHCMYLMLHAQ